MITENPSITSKSAMLHNSEEQTEGYARTKVNINSLFCREEINCHIMLLSDLIDKTYAKHKSQIGHINDTCTRKGA